MAYLGKKIRECPVCYQFGQPVPDFSGVCRNCRKIGHRAKDCNEALHCRVCHRFRHLRLNCSYGMMRDEESTNVGANRRKVNDRDERKKVGENWNEERSVREEKRIAVKVRKEIDMIRSMYKESEEDTGKAPNSQKREKIRRNVRKEFYLEELEIDYKREKICLNNLKELISKGYFGY